jgi:hypothetical protein
MESSGDVLVLVWKRIDVIIPGLYMGKKRPFGLRGALAQMKKKRHMPLF